VEADGVAGDVEVAVAAPATTVLEIVVDKEDEDEEEVVVVVAAAVVVVEEEEEDGELLGKGIGDEDDIAAGTGAAGLG
jgi:hypothetical protein